MVYFNIAAISSHNIKKKKIFLIQIQQTTINKLSRAAMFSVYVSYIL
jgi:hypothetical protein